MRNIKLEHSFNIRNITLNALHIPSTEMVSIHKLRVHVVVMLCARLLYTKKKSEDATHTAQRKVNQQCT